MWKNVLDQECNREESCNEGKSMGRESKQDVENGCQVEGQKNVRQNSGVFGLGQQFVRHYN